VNREPRRASVVGAGSFGTAVALLLERAGLRTTLLCRTPEQAERMLAARQNERYLEGVELPDALEVRVLGNRDDQFHRADLVFLAVPSAGLGYALAELARQGVSRRAAVISLAKGLVPPDGTPPTVALEREYGVERVGCVGGPSHAREMVEYGAGLVAASHAPRLAERVARVFRRAGMVCEVSDDPVGVELAGCAKNAAALAAAAAAPAGSNAAGAAAGKVFAELDALARRRGAAPETFAGLAGTGDLVATVLAAGSRNRQAGQMIAAGMAPGQVAPALGRSAEAVDAVPLLAEALREEGVEAPAVEGLAELLAGRLEPEAWSQRITAPTKARAA
jgi:glycerol-3-phosphate dehydrogenase (NAD(P)+)